MESHVKAFGHPIHPMLIVFPVGVLATAVIFDIVFLIGGNSIFETIAFWDIAIGVIGGLIAAIFGFLDWLSIPSGTRAKSDGLMHGSGNVVIVVLFIISWLLRLNAPGYVADTLALILSFAGIILALFTAWLGGELVYRMGMGVDRGANLDASNSLSGKPAAQTVRGGGAVGYGLPSTGEDHEEPPENQ